MVLLEYKETVNLARIDSKLGELEKLSQNYRNGLAKLVAKKHELEGQLAKKEDYSDKIKALTEELRKIDAELGVNENEIKK